MKDKEIVISQLIGKILKECCKFSHNMLFREYVFDNENCGDFSGFKINKEGERRRGEVDVDDERDDKMATFEIIKACSGNEFDAEIYKCCCCVAKFIEPEVYKLLKDEIVVVFKYNIEVTEEQDMLKCIIQYEIGKI